jgi:hypothetical protein
MNSTSDVTESVNKPLRLVLMSIVGLLPVHAVLSVWLTSNFGYAEVWQGWKEGLLVIAFVVLAFALYQRTGLLAKLWSRRINRMIVLYGVLHLVLFVFSAASLLARFVGLAINLRFLAIFILAQAIILLAKTKDQDRIRHQALKVVAIGGLVVVAFGAMQALFLPNDILKHVGYGPETIAPYRTIDENQNFVRINSTLRGPSPLGLYLVLFVTLVAGWWTKSGRSILVGPKTLQSRWSILAVSLLAALTLYASFSRSAWLATVISLALFMLWGVNKKLRRRLILIGLLGALASIVLVSAFWQTDIVQNTLLHRDPNQSVAEDSDDLRYSASRQAIEDIADNPLGSGSGSAGPASFYDNNPKISENYYLQIGQELGVAGMVLFVCILWLTAKNFWRNKEKLIPRVLLASLVGLSVANLFLHAWAQDEIALIWWGLAGLWYQSDKAPDTRQWSIH